MEKLMRVWLAGLLLGACSSTAKTGLDAGTAVDRDLGMADQAIDKPTDLPSDRVIDLSVDKSLDLSVDKSLDLSADSTNDTPRACVYRDQSCASAPCCSPAICIDGPSGRICAESSRPPDSSVPSGGDGASPAVDAPVVKDAGSASAADAGMGTDALAAPCGVAITGSCFAQSLNGTSDQCTDYTAADLSSWKSMCINSAATHGTWSDKPCQAHFVEGCRTGTVGQAGCKVVWMSRKVNGASPLCSTDGGTAVSP